MIISGIFGKGRSECWDRFGMDNKNVYVFIFPNLLSLLSATSCYILAFSFLIPPSVFFHIITSSYFPGFHLISLFWLECLSEKKEHTCILSSPADSLAMEFDRIVILLPCFRIKYSPHGLFIIMVLLFLLPVMGHF